MVIKEKKLKKHGKTIAPRNREMNEYLVALGHKTHRDKRKQKFDIDKNKKRGEDYDWE